MTDFSKHEMYDKAMAIFADYENSDYETFNDYLTNTKVSNDMSYEDVFAVYILCQKMMWHDEYFVKISGSDEVINL